MRRRRFLSATVGGAAALTGCLAARPPSAVDATVETVQLQYGVVTPNTPDSIWVYDARTPYLVASVRVDGLLAREAFRLEADGVPRPPTTLDRLYRTSWGDDRWYERGRDGGLLLFEPPQEATGDLRLTWPGGVLAIDESITARLDGTPPTFAPSLDLPGTHDGVEPLPVVVEATNDGETAGRFLGALNRVGPAVAYTPVARVSELVPAGATAAISVSDSWGGMPPADRVGDGDPDVTYHLEYAGGRESAYIRLVDSS